MSTECIVIFAQLESWKMVIFIIRLEPVCTQGFPCERIKHLSCGPFSQSAMWCYLDMRWPIGLYVQLGLQVFQNLVMMLFLTLKLAKRDEQ